MLWGENYSLTSFYNNHLDDLFGAIWIPIFPKICNRGFSETKTSHLSSNFRFRKVQITEITTQKKSVVSWPWSGPQKNQDLYTSHNHGNESGWNVFWEKKKVFLFVASHDQVQSFCWVLFWTASSSCMKKTGTKKPRTETQSHGNSLQSDFPCHFQMMEITPQKTNEWLLLQEKQPWMKMFLRFSYYFPLSC